MFELKGHAPHSAHLLVNFCSSTRTMHACDALRHSKRHVVRMGRAAQVSDVAHLVGVQRTVQNNGNMKSDPKYLACEEFPICAFLLLNSFLFFCHSIGFYSGLTSLLFLS